MSLKSNFTKYGALAQFFHWTSASAFIGAYIVVYYVIWFMDDTTPASLPVLNIHWSLGLMVGALVVPRMLWRLVDIKPPSLATSKTEYRLSSAAHSSLYGVMILLPVTGYLGTDASVDLGLFSTSSFRESNLFKWAELNFNVTWDSFEENADFIHHFVGKWIAWGMVAIHVGAALYHHAVRKDGVLSRMLPI